MYSINSDLIQVPGNTAAAEWREDLISSSAY